jgi:hypothetical protein
MVQEQIQSVKQATTNTANVGVQSEVIDEKSIFKKLWFWAIIFGIIVLSGCGIYFLFGN